MNAKEKAKELVGKIDDRLYSLLDIEYNEWPSGRENAAKQCALIVGDEIIKVLDEISIGESGTTEIDYGQSDWREVKEEINKL